MTNKEILINAVKQYNFTPNYALMENLINLAENLGLKYIGRKEGKPEFIGTKEQWEKYEEVKDNTYYCDVCNGTGDIDVLDEDDEPTGKVIPCPDCQRDFYDDPVSPTDYDEPED